MPTEDVTSWLSADGGAGTPGVPQVGFDYSSMSAWQAGQQRDLVALDETETLLCVKGGFTGPNGALLDNVPGMSGWGLDATHYPHIKAAPGSEHNGVAGAGFVMLGNQVSSITLRTTAWVRVTGIELGTTITASNGSQPLYANGGASAYTVINGVIASGLNADAGTIRIVYGYLFNCLAYNAYWGYHINGYYGDRIWNCVAIVKEGDQYGFWIGNGNFSLYNCVGIGPGGPAYKAASNGGNNAADDGTAPGSNPIQDLTADAFVDFQSDGSGDYNPVPGGRLDGSIAGQEGYDLSAYFDDDITGYIRPDPATWERGAFEIQGAVSDISFTGPDIDPQAGTEGESFSMNQTVSDSFTVVGGTATYALQAGTLPTGLSIDPTTGNVVGPVDAAASAGSPYTGIVVRGSFAVYGRWDAASITYAESVGGGLTVDEYQINTVTDGTSTVKSDIGHTTGVHYFEIVCKGTIANAMVGMSDGSAHNGFPGSSAGSLAYWPKKGEIRESGANIGGQPTIAQTITSVYGVIVDIDAATISWFVDGVAGPQDWSLSLIAAEAGGISNLRPAVGNGSTNDTYEYRINAGQDDFAHPENIPDGCHLGWGLDVPVKVAVFK